MHQKRLFLIFAMVVAAQLALAHEGHQPLPTKGVQIDMKLGHVTLSAQARSAIGIATEEVTLGEVASSLAVYAETDSPWQAKAFGSAQLSGRITRLLVRPGDVVEQNQVVAELSSKELEILRLEYQQAKQEVTLNSELLELSRPSAKSGAVPMQRLMELENALRQAENNLQLAMIRAKTLGVDTRQLDESEASIILHQIRSPIAGKIVHSDLAEGKFVAAFEHLFEIVNNDTIWVRLQLLEKDAFKVAVGQPVEITFPDSQIAVKSEIGRIEASIDPKSRVVWAWTSITHPNVIPGMAGDAKIRTSHQNDRLAVPKHSLFSDGLQSYLFVEEASTKKSAEYRKRNVVVGKRKRFNSPSDDGPLEIVNGDVYPGDRVVTNGGHQLSSLFFLGVLKLSESDRNRLAIVTAPVGQQTVAETLDLAAVVSLPPENRSTISSQVAGTIRSHRLSPGKRVEKGDLLMELMSPEFHSTQLALLRTIMDASLTRARAKRLEGIQSDSFSRRQLLETKVSAEQLELEKESLIKRLNMLGLATEEVNSIIDKNEILEYLPIRATTNGFLVKWTGTLGETVEANQSLIEIHDLNSIWIQAHVPIQIVHRVNPANSGQATVLSNPEIKFPVTIARAGPIANESTRTQSIWLTPSSTPPEIQLRNEMRLSIELQTDSGTNVLAVPSSAVIQDGLQKFVFILKAEGYIERRRVITGRSNSQWTEITSGIVAGEEAIIAGGRELQTAYASLR